MQSLDSVYQYINAGQSAEAKRALVHLLRLEPRNVQAWLLLASLLDDVDKQADCYKHILTIDPGNQQASDGLQQLTYKLPPTTEDGTVLRCPQCGGPLDVRFVGQLQDKRAVCTYCGTEVDLPDTYQHIEKSQTHESLPGGGKRIVDTVTVQTRSDGPGTIPSLDPPREDITSRRETISYIEQQLGISEKETLTGRPFGGLLKALTRRNRRVRFGIKGVRAPETPKARDLTPSDIISLAGGPIPPDQRRQCPQCQATIAKDATRCEWCGTQLDPEP